MFKFKKFLVLFNFADISESSENGLGKDPYLGSNLQTQKKQQVKKDSTYQILRIFH